MFKSWDISEKRFHNSCLEVERSKESLYLHPQSFSGVILKNSIKLLHDLLETAKAFKLEGVDVYETYHDTDDETHLLNLDARKNEIRDDILREFKTKRKDLFCRIDRLKNVSSKYCAKRVKSTDGQNGGYGITYNYLLDIFSQLIEERLIVCGMRNTETIYRTINRSEQKTLGITLHQIAR